MEQIKFWIWCSGTHDCRITANSCLTEVRKIADGGCILTLDVMLSEINHITKEVKEKFNAQAVFELADIEHRG